MRASLVMGAELPLKGLFVLIAFRKTLLLVFRLPFGRPLPGESAADQR
jgi:hypothetical protein